MPVTFTKALRAHIDKTPKTSQVAKGYQPLPSDPFCGKCGEQYPARRLDLGFRVCLSCSDISPVLANSALHKQGYTYERNAENLSVNPYSTHK